MFIKVGDGKITGVIKNDDLTDEQKKIVQKQAQKDDELDALFEKKKDKKDGEAN